MTKAKIEAQLNQALTHAEDAEARFHIREALQHLVGEGHPDRDTRPTADDDRVIHRFDDDRNPDWLTLIDEDASDISTAWLSIEADAELVGDVEEWR